MSASSASEEVKEDVQCVQRGYCLTDNPSLGAKTT